MKILHLSDFHYGSDSYTKFSDNKIIDELCLSLLKHKNAIDLVIFSGDLVNKGIVETNFYNAENCLLKKISEILNIKNENIILTCGNHDVNRGCKLTSLETFFERDIRDSDSLNKFVLENDQDFINSTNCLQNYNKFNKLFYSSDSEFHQLFNIHKIEKDGKKVGILSINSAWRAIDDDCKGKLLFPKVLLENALLELKDCYCKFAVVHHPLFYFKDFNYKELQELIHKEFDIIFSGHVHQSEINTHFKQNNGIFATVSSATLTYDKSYIGYSLNEYDFLNKSQVICTEVKLNDQNKFIENESVVITIPCSVEKDHQNKIRNKIQSKIILELANGRDLLLNLNVEDDNEEIFNELFNTPIIKTKTKTEISTSDSQSNFDFEKLLINENNYFIYGYDKSGKSSLLKYIQIRHLKRYSTFGNIPFYFDFKELAPVISENWDLANYMSKYFELSKNKTVELIHKHSFRLLIDNFDPNCHLLKIINDFLILYPKVNFIICCDHLTSRIVDNYNIGNREYQKLYLHDITRKEVRQYAKKYTSQVDTNDQLLDRIVSFCKQLEMPLNYWTVSIMLLIHKKSRFDSSKNLFELLDLSVDEILNKKRLTLTQSRLSFKQIKRLCGRLASHLLLEHSKYIYSASYSVILIFLEKEVEKNVRLTANAKEILDYLILSGVLKEKEDTNFTFRLNGFFEYFVAYDMSQNDKLKQLILSDDSIYLSFKNEIEIYSGMENGDAIFLKQIFSKTKVFFETTNKSFKDLGTPDEILSIREQDVEKENNRKIVENIKPLIPFDEETRDMLKDESDPVNINSSITVKKIFDTSILTSEIYERYISILARVFKTMDEINDPQILNDIFDLLLETYINFGFYMITEFKNQSNTIKDTQEIDSKNNIIELLKKFIPIITQVSFSDGIAHFNIEAIIEKKIDELKLQSRKNQYYLFTLYFVLMDIDEKNILKYTDDVLELLHIGILRYSSILKLNYYFSFNGQRNKKIADYLKVKIQEAQMKLDDKTDKRKLQHNIEKRGKMNFLKGRR
jgi:predicted phosphodiesterase